MFENLLKFSKRRPIWTIKVAAKLDQSRVLVTKFHQNRSTLKGRSAGQRDTQTDKPVGFYCPIAPPVPNAPSSECPGASIATHRRAAGSIRISRRASCCCSNAIAEIAIGANFKCISSVSFVGIESNFFLQYTGDTDTKNDGLEF